MVGSDQQSLTNYMIAEESQPDPRQHGFAQRQVLGNITSKVVKEKTDLPTRAVLQGTEQFQRQ
jgi:hypothetical protein